MKKCRYFLTNFDGRGILVFLDNQIFESTYRLPPLHPTTWKILDIRYYPRVPIPTPASASPLEDTSARMNNQFTDRVLGGSTRAPQHPPHLSGVPPPPPSLLGLAHKTAETQRTRKPKGRGNQRVWKPKVQRPKSVETQRGSTLWDGLF